MMNVNLTVVDANLIVLEGISLYLALAIFLLISLCALALVVAGIKDDEKIANLQAENKRLEISNTKLSNENWRYRLKFGVLDTGEKNTNGRNKM